MKIENDLVVFDAEDVARLSYDQRKALIAFAGARLSPEQALSDVVNGYLSLAVDSARLRSLSSLRVLGEAILDAPDEVKAQINDLIAQATELLGVATPSLIAA